MGVRLVGNEDGTVNFETTVRLSLDAVIDGGRKGLETALRFKCTFGDDQPVEWLRYEIIDADRRELTIRVAGRTAVPLPGEGAATPENIKASIY